MPPRVDLVLIVCLIRYHEASWNGLRFFRHSDSYYLVISRLPMGVRFACHVCNKRLNIKRELAGRRGVCPQCQCRFRIPMEDAEFSSPLDDTRQTQKGTQHSGSHSNGVQSNGAQSQAENSGSHQGVMGTANGGATAVVTEGQVGVDNRYGDEFSVGTVDHGIQAGEQQSVEQDGGGTPVLPAGTILEDDPDATWYVRPPSGGQYGPATTQELHEWIEQGRVAASALLWRDGWPQWRDASEALPELSTSLPGATSHNAPVGVAAGPEVSHRKSGGKDPVSNQSGVSFSGAKGIGAERRSRTMRRLSMISVLVAIAATLISVLIYVVNR